MKSSMEAELLGIYEAFCWHVTY